MHKITSSKLDAQKLARLLDGTTTKVANKEKAHTQVVATINELLTDPTKIVSPSYSVEVSHVKDYLGNQAAKIVY